MIKDWLDSYKPADRDQATAALRAIMQVVALAGLYRAGFYKKGAPLNLSHFVLRAIGSGDWKKSKITEKEFRDLLRQKIDSVNMDRVKEDISCFIPDQDRLKIWSPQYFHDLSEKIKFT
jgi:hypothetical protein